MDQKGEEGAVKGGVGLKVPNGKCQGDSVRTLTQWPWKSPKNELWILPVFNTVFVQFIRSSEISAYSRPTSNHAWVYRSSCAV